MGPPRPTRTRLLLHAAAVALASASSAMTHSTAGSGSSASSVMLSGDFCFDEDVVWTPTKEDGRVILYDSCILRITVDMTGVVKTPPKSLGVEDDGCTVRYHLDAQGQGWVYRGAMKWQAALIPYKNAVHVSVMGHRENTCTLEFMPIKVDEEKCPDKNMCPKRFFPIDAAAAGKNDKRCCEECTAGVCRKGTRLKDSLDQQFTKESECCEDMKEALLQGQTCNVNQYQTKDLADVADGVFCMACPGTCPPGNKPDDTNKKTKAADCCTACDACGPDSYKDHDGTKCCTKCDCAGTNTTGKSFLNTAITTKTSVAQCCQACPATCPSGQKPKSGATKLDECCVACGPCEAKQYMSGGANECCKDCGCTAGQYYKLETGKTYDSKASCCGDCPTTCPNGQRPKAQKKGVGMGVGMAVDSIDQCCEAIPPEELCKGKCVAPLYAIDPRTNGGACCEACDIKNCEPWQTLNPEPKNKGDCCKAVTKVEFCGADQFACPSSSYPKHSNVLDTGKITAIGSKGSGPMTEDLMTAQDAATTDKSEFCCGACACKPNEVMMPFPTKAEDCCKPCGACTARQYMVQVSEVPENLKAIGTVQATVGGGHKDQSTCCAKCECDEGQYYKNPEKAVEKKGDCCVACHSKDCKDWQKPTTKKGPFNDPGECCEARTWEDYCPTVTCTEGIKKEPKEFLSGRVHPPGEKMNPIELNEWKKEQEAVCCRAKELPKEAVSNNPVVDNIEAERVKDVNKDQMSEIDDFRKGLLDFNKGTQNQEGEMPIGTDSGSGSVVGSDTAAVRNEGTRSSSSYSDTSRQGKYEMYDTNPINPPTPT